MVLHFCAIALLGISALSAQVRFAFEPSEIGGGLDGVHTLDIVDLNNDGRPDIVAGASGRIVWFENPDWKMRPLTGSGAGGFVRGSRPLPIGRVNRVRHLAVTGDEPGILRQATQSPDPNRAALRELVVNPAPPWERVASLPRGARVIAWADFDGDGSDELAVGGEGLMLFDRDAGDRWKRTKLDPAAPSALAAADLDGDGLAELVTADSSGSVKIHRNESRSWRRHIIASGYMNQTVIGGDFTGDGKVDVVSTDAQGKRTILYVAPDWKPVVLQTRTAAIHSEIIDVDADGDLDYIGARYSPGLVFWLENPDDPIAGPWPFHVIDDHAGGGVNGIHGVITGDVDRDGTLDLIANSGQPNGAFPNSLVWFRIPSDPTAPWERNVFANGDAPGLSHYHGFGDVNGDGRGDIASSAKIGDDGNWFAWWEQPADPTGSWTKHSISNDEPGATNILIADINGDGANDFIGSRGHGTGLVWFENPSWKARQINTRLIGPHSLALGDIDGDGDLDAATCAKDSHIAAWFENDGKGAFTTHHIHENQSSYDVRLIDMDADGDLDLLNAGQVSGNVAWFENPSR